jgi:hypothetical protein
MKNRYMEDELHLVSGHRIAIYQVKELDTIF